MKKLFNETRELDFSELLDVNGGYSSKSTLNNRERFSIIDGKGYSSTTGFIGAPKPGNIPDFLSASVPLNQLDFDKEYGFSDGSLAKTKSCKTTSMVNSYISTYGLSKTTLDKAVETWKENKWVDTDGSPLELNRMSNSLSKLMGLDKHYEIPGKYVDNKWVQTSFAPNEINYNSYDAYIVKSRNDTLRSEHYTLINSKIGSIDSLDPHRANASGYKPILIQPLEMYKNY